MNPAPGTWTLVVDFSEPVVGNEISEPYTGDIRFNAVKVSATGLPNSAATKLAAGTPVTVPVNVTNTGIAAEDYFVDPRLNGSTTVTLAPFAPASGLALPLVVGTPVWFVPTETSAVSVTQVSSLPTMFDFGPFAGDPDLSSHAPGRATVLDQLVG